MILGSALHGMEWGDARKRSQCTVQGKKNRTNDGRTVLEGSCHRGRDQDGVTEHLDREVGVIGYGTPGAPEGDRGCGISIGDNVDASHSHPAWRGV